MRAYAIMGVFGFIFTARGGLLCPRHESVSAAAARVDAGPYDAQ